MQSKAGAGGGPPSARYGNVCVGLLVVAICLQLYFISLWLAPSRPSSDLLLSREAARACANSANSHIPHSEHTPLAIIAAERQKAAETNALPDATSALTALHLLQKFIRMHRNQLDKGTLSALQAGGVDGGLVPATPDSPLSVGGGLQLGDDKHGHGAAHTHSDKEVAHVDHDHHAGDRHDEAFLASRPNLYHTIWLNVSNTWSLDMLRPERHHSFSPEEKERHRQCMEWLEQYKVKPDVEWGSLPQHLHARFDELRCSDVISVDRVANYIQEHADLYNRVWAVPEQRQVVKAEPGMEHRVIAIIVAITTRSLTVNGPEDLALFNQLLPTFVKTADVGFEYWMYLGYDQGDPWLDSEPHLQLVRDWFASHVTAELAKKGIVAKLVLATWDNPFKKPGPAFNYVTGVAYADGATWMYRINDDQSFDTPWAKDMVAALEAMGPPYGVVGGATHILVVDFVHRTHHEIFPTHYPPSLQAWWMDNWITQVYGKKRTQRVKSARITHLTGSHGTRYGGFYEIGQYMRGEIVRGRYMFEEYLSHTPGMAKALEEYKSDEFNYNVPP